MKADDIRKQIADAKRRGFKPGSWYWRVWGSTKMVDVTPGNFVNESVAGGLGVKPREDAEHAPCR